MCSGLLGSSTSAVKRDVWSGSTLFAHACLSDYLRYKWCFSFCEKKLNFQKEYYMTGLHDRTDIICIWIRLYNNLIMIRACVWKIRISGFTNEYRYQSPCQAKHWDGIAATQVQFLEWECERLKRSSCLSTTTSSHKCDKSSTRSAESSRTRYICPAFTTLWANSADKKLVIVFLFFPWKQDLLLLANCLL